MKAIERRHRRIHSLETRARMSEARKKACADPEVRARRSEASKKASPLALLTPEQRADYQILRRKGGYSRVQAFAMMGIEA